MTKLPFIIGGSVFGVLGVTAVALRIHAVSKQKQLAAAGQPTTQAVAAAAATGNTIELPDASGNFTLPPTPQVQQALAAAQDTAPGDVVAAAQVAASQVTAQGTPANTAGQQAIVTTKDPSPAGDLIVRDAPNASATQIGGVDKNGQVTILDDSDPTFAQITWAGGNWPAVTGFARKAFLRLI